MKIKIETNKTIPYQTKIEGLKIILLENKFLLKKSFWKKYICQKKFGNKKFLVNRISVGPTNLDAK